MILDCRTGKAGFMPVREILNITQGGGKFP